MSINISGKFEEAMQELERIVGELEEGNVSLERSVELYNRGKELHQYCDKVIKDITLNIESIDPEQTQTSGIDTH
ncbi:exodeoxyribonuclease VII small subunit [Candidatus Anaplasma sp. TIGMIC]|uniref:exodeoxyribonuclease VII small subunit n=1 Tax=Candidatus Anaplasma sp. TIGMIC TaxID=3020713 RepID=UPI00232FCF5D|nr:exodeoxyribonuclease VII small subunit [Candidatus Anaplasma sp. TIGMIC]MDB1135588.1 exodeoxyribonuclease VII small subunit [Candidatus Anaplasma sp. TIGMIC]